MEISSGREQGALAFEAYASASGFSVTGSTPSLHAHSKVERPDMFWLHNRGTVKEPTASKLTRNRNLRTNLFPLT
jgi:hypothetical protein